VTSSLERSLERALGKEVVRVVPIAGGDVNDAFRLELAEGPPLFVKTRAAAPPEMYQREAEGLQWLREADALRIPAVVLASAECLVLEWVAASGRARDFDERLGRGLAHLHRAGAPHFGLSRDNFIGPLIQANRPCDTWAEFYAERRIAPLVARASGRGLLPGAMQLRFEELRARMSELVGPLEPASRLHGDLWSGNVHCDERGEPVLIDPAVYGGNREIDLAMLCLFGSPSERFFRAYDESYPRNDGHEQRVALYQLYPLLVHVCLFGASYVPQLRSKLDAALQA
jgi:fructosamine-3-kinase